MLEFFIHIFAVLFIAVGPIDNAAVYAGLGHRYTPQELKRMAFRACLVATIVLLSFSVAGNFILKMLDLDLFALRIGGGVLLFILSIQIVMEEHQSAEEFSKKHKNRDLSVFPLGVPLIAGPATITQMTIFLSSARGDLVKQGIIIGSLLALMVLSYILLRAAGKITKLIGEGGAEILSRVLGILLAAISVDLIITGLKDSGLFG